MAINSSNSNYAHGIQMENHPTGLTSQVHHMDTLQHNSFVETMGNQRGASLLFNNLGATGQRARSALESRSHLPVHSSGDIATVINDAVN